MTINYPIIETQLRLIRALQKGYVEAIEAGDWQAADYRVTHLHQLCEGLYNLSQLLDKGRTEPTTVTPKNKDSWVNSIRSVSSTFSLDQPLPTDNQSVESPPPLPELKPEQLNEEWRSNFQVSHPTSVDETP
jgi:hypothetical protein